MSTLPNVYVTAELWVCDVCMFANCNGEDIRDDASSEPAPWALYPVGRFDPAARSQTHAPNFDANAAWDSDDYGITDFSSGTCDGCGQTLAGSRHRFATLTPLSYPTATPACPGGLRYLHPHAVTRIIVDDDAPRNRSVSGYGGAIPTAYRVTLADNRTRRVYAMCYGNSASFYVTVRGKRAHVDIDTEHALQTARDAHYAALSQTAQVSA